MQSQNRLVFMILICLIIAAAFIYFTPFADRGRRIDSQPREILPRGDLADFAVHTIDQSVDSAGRVGTYGHIIGFDNLRRSSGRVSSPSRSADSDCKQSRKLGK